MVITMKGDENLKYALSEDGYTLLNVENEWKYATVDDDGRLIPSRFSLTALEDESAGLRNFKRRCPKHLIMAHKTTAVCGQGRAQGIGQHNGEPIIGERRALVVLMQYKDVKLSKSRDDFESLFNEEGFSTDNAKGSVKDFYTFASAGKLSYISDIYGPYTASNDMRYYGQNSSIGGGDANAIELCLEAIRNLPKDMDYSLYDNDHDGIVDNIHIIFAGYGEEAGASSDAIWSHEYPYKIVMKSEVGFNFSGYSCTPELRGNSGEKISHIGVICHELGHALGADDYYDTNYSTEGSYDGTGQWDIMASGSWNDEGRLPPNFNPYVRTHDFGWEKQVELTKEETVSLPPYPYRAEDGAVLRMNTDSANDYFLLENRQQQGFDASLPGSGLMIYHVHPDIDYLSKSNRINSTNPQGFYPVCASGSEPLSKQYGDINTDGCPFPGSYHVTSFSSATSPAAKAWDGSHARFSINDIRQMQDGSITLNIVDEKTDIKNPNDNDELVTVFHDSFETGISNYETTVIMGKKDWTYYPNNKIISDTEIIPSPTDGKKLLMLFTGKSRALCEAEIESKEITVIPGRKYYLSFDLATSSLTESPSSVFRFWIKDDNTQVYTQTIKDIKDTWEHIEIPFTSSSNSIEYGFYGNICTGGLFIDNVKIGTAEDSPSTLQTNTDEPFAIWPENNRIIISSPKESNLEIYTIGGSLVKRTHLTANRTTNIYLPQGIYVARTSTGHSHKIIIK